MDEGQSGSSERQPRYMFDFIFNAVISFFFFFLLDAAIKKKKQKGEKFFCCAERHKSGSAEAWARIGRPSRTVAANFPLVKM